MSNAKVNNMKSKKTKSAAKPKPKAKTKARPKAAAVRKIAIERFIRAKPEDVWGLWTTEKGLCRWIATSAAIDARAGGRADIVMKDYDHATENRIVALEPARRLEIEWERTAKWGPTRVEVTLAPERGGTRLSFVQSGFGDGPEWDEWYESFNGGWAHLLARLLAAAEGGGQRDAAIMERVAAPAKKVWDAIGSAKGLARWFAGGGRLDPRAGGKYALDAGPTKIEGEVREYEPGRTLAISWASEPCTQQTLPAPTLVMIHLTPHAAGGTTVSLCHSGFGDGPEWDAIYARHKETWGFLLKNLKSVLEHGIDQRGRTIERSLFVRAERGAVYDLFATKKGLESWFPTKAEVGAKPGDPYRLLFSGPEHAEPVRIDGRLLEAKKGERLAFLWRSGARPSKARPTIVTVDFAEAPGGTRVTLVESGFGEGPEWDAHYLENSEGWASELDKIFPVLEGVGARGRSIVMEKSVAAPPERAWEAVASAAGISRWWLAAEAFEAREGGAYHLKAMGFDVRGEVREAAAGRAVSYTWSFFPCSGGVTLPAPTLITFMLTPEKAGGTRITLVHSGFGAGGPWDEIYDSHEQGWTFFMANLASVLDRGVDKRGRTIEREIVLHAKPEEVYRLWTTAAGLASWFTKAEIEPRAGGRMRWWGEGTEYEGEVLVADAPRRLLLAWRTNVPTEVEVTFEAAAGGTRLRLVHSGFGDGPAWDAWYRLGVEGWAAGFGNLFAVVEGIGARGREITITKTLAAPPAKAWRALATSEGISSWWAKGEIDARPGGAYRFAHHEDARGEVREAVEGAALSFTWNGCSVRLPAPTLVSFTLAAAAGGGTRITLVHSGFGAGDAWDEIYDSHEQGWTFFMANLASVLDHGLDRRTGRAIERTVEVAAPPERVWRALTDPAELARWQCKRAEMDARLGGRFLWDWSGTPHAEEVTGTSNLYGEGEVIAAEPGRRLELAYRVPAFKAGTHPTLISFALAPALRGCRLTVVHSGFDEGPGPWDGYYRGHRESWDVDLPKLLALCEGRPAPAVVLRCEVAFPGEPEAAIEALARVLPDARREHGALVTRRRPPRSQRPASRTCDGRSPRGSEIADMMADCRLRATCATCAGSDVSHILRQMPAPVHVQAAAGQHPSRWPGFCAPWAISTSEAP